MSERGAQRRQGALPRHAHHGLQLPAHVLVQLAVGIVEAWLQAKLLVQGVDTEDMVEMCMRAQHMAQLQPLLPDILRNGGALSIVVGTAVDDGGIAGVSIAHHEAVLLYGVALEGLDVQHIVFFEELFYGELKELKELKGVKGRYLLPLILGVEGVKGMEGVSQSSSASRFSRSRMCSSSALTTRRVALTPRLSGNSFCTSSFWRFSRLFTPKGMPRNCVICSLV